MLICFRAWQRSIAMTVLLAIVSLATTSALSHAPDCHDDCLRLVAHDASAHAIRAAGSATADLLHCVACHLTRLPFNPRGAERVQLVPFEDGTSGLPLDSAAFISTAPASQPPLRAPPLSLIV